MPFGKFKTAVAPVPLPSTEWSCTRCDKTFTMAKSLKRHMDVHDASSKLRFVCQHVGCNYSGRQRSNLKEHVNSIHRKVKDLRCPYCPFETASSSSLVRHQNRMHPEERHVPASEAQAIDSSRAQHNRASIRALMNPAPAPIAPPRDFANSSPTSSERSVHYHGVGYAAFLASAQSDTDSLSTSSTSLPSCTFSPSPSPSPSASRSELCTPEPEYEVGRDQSARLPHFFSPYEVNLQTTASGYPKASYPSVSPDRTLLSDEYYYRSHLHFAEEADVEMASDDTTPTKQSF
ncbi:hypothetical protein CYLTODRAFT_407509 [Cylindrobasidium torrendii FP15055 ss-10]|uniref:C2H2-type domain-containing protein n=1 Tax=Cylindrobasidium torrendii FP15055 ss-10 TaxID=1314674 RepID=A0A0D7BPY0_9AGAR|nr:hypothetical protein CYLTODRAFT_407509 [Cylindrobasidium torrendii FP15055 ss-10]